MNHTVYLLTGSNLGERLHYLEAAESLINDEIGKVNRSSSIFETAAWGNEDQSPFLNQVLECETNLSAQEVLKVALQLEIRLGRERFEKWGPRSIDIDILFYEDFIVNEEKLVIPHPGIAQRRFVLEPLAELFPEFQHPVHMKTIRELLEECQDSLSVQRYVISRNPV